MGKDRGTPPAGDTAADSKESPPPPRDDADGSESRDYRIAFTRERESTKRLKAEVEDLRAKFEKAQADLEETREETDDARLVGALASHGLQLVRPEYGSIAREALRKAHPEATRYDRLPAAAFEKLREDHRALFAASAKAGSGAGSGASPRELADGILMGK